MADDQEQRNFEVLKLRISFLQHITTLSGAAILIVLALIQRSETATGVILLATAVPWFVLGVLISMTGVQIVIIHMELAGHTTAICT